MKVVVRVSPLVRQSAASEALGKTLQTQSAALRIYVKETMASFVATVTVAKRCRPSGHHDISAALALLVTPSQPAVRTHVACSAQLP